MSQTITMPVAQTPPAAAPGSTFRSILFAADTAPEGIDERPQPACFSDLNLDQIVASVVALREPFRLAGYFHTPLDDPDLIDYRQEVFRDLEEQAGYDVVAEFSAGMHAMRDRLTHSRKSHYHFQTQRWFLDAARAYCDAVATLADDLHRVGPRSRGLTGLGRYLRGYLDSTAFTTLRADAARVAAALDEITYNVWVRGAKITVAAFDGEPDYTAEVAATFERFQQQGTVPVVSPKRRRRPIGRPARPGQFMDHVEAQVLDQVAVLFPDRFAALDDFCRAHERYLDRTVVTFDREVQFYLAYLDHVAPLRRAGLALSNPELSTESKAENATGTFDLALAAQLMRDRPMGAANPVVCNDVRLDGTERILVVSGPNNGGKTTLARTFGQLHYLAKLGCPVPGRDVRLFLVDQIYPHFEREEDIGTLAGKLQDELNRLHEVFARATPRSLVIMNEMFSSTSVRDALALSREMLRWVSELDALGVCVTFLDELSMLNDKTVSMVSTVEPDDPARRTHKVVRRRADGRAYAQALAEKYGLTYSALRGRMSR